ncbi:hypothetical protein [Actibacterium atlanticum]|uniref:hypothetical protein n=1 Tax=Actibacterium atlanticum TaxID=1461693 RepID=UPI000AF39300|nr:hypothetical protein [Actibacterium atlanticum]
MNNVEKIPSASAQNALKLLEQAWAYYTPLSKPALTVADKDTPQNFAYYEAA